MAWFDYPLEMPNAAHAPAECSNAGLCDERTGSCKCLPGFSGAACDRALCPGELPLEGLVPGGGEVRLAGGHYDRQDRSNPWGEPYVHTARLPPPTGGRDGVPADGTARDGMGRQVLRGSAGVLP